jgi:hypothetical protein
MASLRTFLIPLATLVVFLAHSSAKAQTFSVLYTALPEMPAVWRDSTPRETPRHWPSTASRSGERTVTCSPESAQS